MPAGGQRPGPPAGGGAAPSTGNAVHDLFQSQHRLAETLGEWAFYAIVALILIALLRRIPYRLFAWTHLLVAPVFLVLAWHALVLLDWDAWFGPLGPVMLFGLALGAVAALMSMLRLIGRVRRVPGRIDHVREFSGVHSLLAEVVLEPGWPVHWPGQFAFLRSSGWEGAHPFTIASRWDPGSRRVRFIAKALGDYTERLAQTARAGDAVTVEGPYGEFTFNDDARRQVWVSGGIGITPFVAGMEQRAARRAGGHDPGVPVDLFHSTAEDDGAAHAELRRDAAESGVVLHLLIDERDGHLTGARLREAVPEWREASLWLCGPTSFADALRADFAAQGFDVRHRFHQELFDMRGSAI